MPIANPQPLLPQTVLQQPLHHIPLRKHLRLTRDLMGFHLPARIQLLIQLLPLRVIPILIHPSQRRIIPPSRHQLRHIQRLNHRPQRHRWNRDQFRHPHRPKQTRQLDRPLVIQQFQQRPHPLIPAPPTKLRRKLPPLPIPRTRPSPRHHLGLN